VDSLLGLPTKKHLQGCLHILRHGRIFLKVFWFVSRYVVSPPSLNGFLLYWK